MLEKKKRPPQHTRILSLQQLDSGNFCCVVWYKIILIFAAFPLHPPANTHTHTHQPNPPTQAALSTDLFRQFTDARHTLRIIVREYYFKTQTDTARRNEALRGCWTERRDTGLKNDTASRAISFSRSKRNIWLVWAPKSTNGVKETV